MTIESGYYPPGSEFDSDAPYNDNTEYDTEIIFFLYLDSNELARSGELSIYYSKKKEAEDDVYTYYIHEYILFPSDSKEYINLKQVIGDHFSISEENIKIL